VWSYTSIAPYVFMAWCSINKTQGQCYLLPPRSGFQKVLKPIFMDKIVQNFCVWGFIYFKTSSALWPVPMNPKMVLVSPLSVGLFKFPFVPLCDNGMASVEDDLSGFCRC
jgi:hypothetical protein